MCLHENEDMLLYPSLLTIVCLQVIIYMLLLGYCNSSSGCISLLLA